jgi:hypothetical protein
VSSNVFCLVSRWGVLPESDEWCGISIIACSASDSNNIAIADGWSPHDHGSTLSAAELLRKEWYRHSVKNGQHVYELEPPGWFERRCALLQCSWFFVLAQQLAAGELVPVGVVQQAYRAHNDGRTLPTGTWGQLQKLCETS